MLVMAVLLLAGTTFLTISSTESEIADNQRATARAFAAAETALHRAVARLSADSTYRGEANVAVGGGAATIGVTNPASQICLSRDLNVSAWVPVRGGQAQARILATADQAVYPFQWGLLAVSGALTLSSDDASLASRLDSYDSRLGAYDPIVNGGGSVNVGAIAGGVELRNVELIGGAAGDTVVSSPATASNLGPTGDAPPSLPAPSGPWAAATTVGDGGQFSVSAGTYHVTSLTLGNGVRITPTSTPVTIYVRDAFTAGDNVTIGGETTGGGADRTVRLIANSWGGPARQFKTGENFRLFGTLYGTNTDVVLGPGAIVQGAIIGRTILGPKRENEPCCSGRPPTLHFDRALTRRPVCTQSTFSVRPGTWREALP